MTAPLDISTITAEALAKLSSLQPGAGPAVQAGRTAASQETINIENLVKLAAAQGAQMVLLKQAEEFAQVEEFEKRAGEVRAGVFGIIERAQKVSTLMTLQEVGALDPDDAEDAAIIAQIPDIVKRSMEEQEELADAVAEGDAAGTALDAGLVEAAATDPEMAAELAEQAGDEVTPEDVDAIADLIIEESAGGMAEEGEKVAANRTAVLEKVSQMADRTQRMFVRRAQYKLAEYQALAAQDAE